MKPVVRRWARLLAAGAVVALAGVQFVPYGRAHTNPPAVAEPSWDAPQTRVLARRACFDCHSNETQWPAYSHVAPVSWLVQRDVERGRAALNFSEWQRPQKEAHEAAEAVQEGKMPLAAYSALHAHARLDSLERAQLAQGLAKTLGASPAEENGR